MRFLVLLFLSLGLTSCVSKKNQMVQENLLILKDSYCKAPKQYNYQGKFPSYNSDSILAANQHLHDQFTDQSILILNALGAIDEVEEINKLKKDSTIQAQLKMLKLKNVINSKISIALVELDAVAAEFDCEGERVAQMASYVDQLNDSRNNRLVLYSIFAGAAASIASGIIKSDSWGSAVDIGGGVIGAGLSLATFSPKGKKVEFIHARNILRDIWLEKQVSANFPPFVWYMYTEKKFANKSQESIIQNMKQSWVKYHFHGDQKAADASLLFHDGGIYRASELHDRAAMLNQMQSATRTINQNINYLLLDLDRFIM